jgi:hypothetical protein
MKKEKEYTKLFESLVRSKGWEFRPSTKHEDMHEHVDCHVTIMNGSTAVRSISIDLKGRKFNSRQNEGKIDCLCQYIEFMNVRGDRGWLFGKSEYIAILNETEDQFYLIKRKALITFCEDLFGVKLNGNIKEVERKLFELKDRWVNKSYQSHHKLYRRYGREDIVTQIDMSDVQSLCKIKI